MIISAGGTLSADLDKGTASLTVKLSFIKLISKEFNLCDLAEQTEGRRPLVKGPVNYTKIVAIPDMVPAGTYHIQADVYTAGHDRAITCLESDVHF